MSTDSMDVLGIFDQALKIQKDEERYEYLLGACNGDNDLIKQLTKLLEAHGKAGTFLEPVYQVTLNALDGQSPMNGGWGDLVMAEEELGPGSRIDSYVIEKKLGSGGFGVVYSAKQNSPLKRDVALKLVKPGMDTEQVINRFNHERHALAILDHDRIAKIFDAGKTPLGRPYFAMELVEGKHLNQYCDDQKLNIEERLELFLSVLNGVRHAHQKGLLHRDLKPSNILVRRDGSKHYPKIIDFGIAKSMDRPLTGSLTNSFEGQLLGTPAYMSPEQVESGSKDVDVRTDIFALGVILFELLTGSTPIPKENLAGASIEEFLKLIRVSGNVTPSNRVLETGGLDADETILEIARLRGTEPTGLRRKLRGELDWIVAKAMNVDRELRYGSVESLADDILRFLRGDPVEAGPVSRVYLLKKFAGKHRLVLASVTAVMFIFLVAAVASGWLAFRAMHSEKKANMAFAAEQATNQKLIESSEVQRKLLKDYKFMVGFLAKAMQATYPSESGPPQMVHQMLLKMEKELAMEDQSPGVRATMLQDIGEALYVRGKYNDAKRVLGTAWELCKKQFGGDDAKTVSIRYSIASNCRHTTDWPEGIRHITAVVKSERESDETLGLIKALNVQGDLYVLMGEYSDAQTVLEESTRLALESLGNTHMQTHYGVYSLAAIYTKQGVHEKELELLQKIRLPNNSNGIESLAFNERMGKALIRNEKLEQARGFVKESLRIAKQYYGPKHAVYIRALCDIAVLESRAGNFDRSISHFELARDIQRAEYPEDKTRELEVAIPLADVYRRAEKFDLAADLYPESIRIATQQFGALHRITVAAKYNLALSYSGAGDTEKSIQLLTQLCNALIAEESDRYMLAMCQGLLCKAYRESGQLDESIQAFNIGKKSCESAFAKYDVRQTRLLNKLNSEAINIAEAIMPENNKTAIGLLVNVETDLLDQFNHISSNQDAEAAIQEQLVTSHLKKLIRLYEVWGKDGKVKEWQGKFSKHEAKRISDE